MKKLLLISILPLLLGATKYVSPTGSDGAAGTEGAPYETIAYALTQISGGDTIYLQGGVHDEAAIAGAADQIPSGTSPSTPTRIIGGYPSEVAIFRPTGTESASWYIGSQTVHKSNIWMEGWVADGVNQDDDNAQRSIIRVWNAANITFTNMHFQNCPEGAGMLEATHYGVTNLTVVDCTFTNWAYGDFVEIMENRVLGDTYAAHALYLGTAWSNTVYRNIFHNNQCTSNASAFQVAGGGTGGFTTGYDNEFHDNWVYVPGPVLQIGGIGNNAKVYNNILIAHGQNKVTSGKDWNVLLGFDGYARSTNLLFANNTLLSISGVTATRGIWLPWSRPAWNPTVVNNIIYGAGAKAETYATPDSGGWTNNLVSPGFSIADATSTADIDGTITDDPELVDVVSPTYDTQISTTNSPAVDAGVDLSSIFTTDYNGTNRPQNVAWDIGAYEKFWGPPDPIESTNRVKYRGRGRNSFGGRIR